MAHNVGMRTVKAMHQFQQPVVRTTKSASSFKRRLSNREVASSRGSAHSGEASGSNGVGSNGVGSAEMSAPRQGGEEGGQGGSITSAPEARPSAPASRGGEAAAQRGGAGKRRSTHLARSSSGIAKLELVGRLAGAGGGGPPGSPAPSSHPSSAATTPGSPGQALLEAQRSERRRLERQVAAYNRELLGTLFAAWREEAAASAADRAAGTAGLPPPTPADPDAEPEIQRETACPSLPCPSLPCPSLPCPSLPCPSLVPAHAACMLGACLAAVPCALREPGILVGSGLSARFAASNAQCSPHAPSAAPWRPQLPGLPGGAGGRVRHHPLRALLAQQPHRGGSVLQGPRERPGQPTALRGAAAVGLWGRLRPGNLDD
jgi:hypothetical protein